MHMARRSRSPTPGSTGWTAASRNRRGICTGFAPGGFQPEEDYGECGRENLEEVVGLLEALLAGVRAEIEASRA